MNYDHNKKFGLLKFHSGYGKVNLNSPKGYSLKIINAQTARDHFFLHCSNDVIKVMLFSTYLMTNIYKKGCQYIFTLKEGYLFSKMCLYACGLRTQIITRLNEKPCSN